MFSALTQVVPHLQQRRIARRSFSTMASAQKTWKLDASSEGCTGLFYRTRKADGSFATDKDPQWPRNGFVFKGTEVVPGWVQLADKPEKWLPVSGHGNTYLHPQE